MNFLISTDAPLTDLSILFSLVTELNDLLNRTKKAKRYKRNHLNVINWELYDDVRKIQGTNVTGFTLKVCWQKVVAVEMPFPFSRTNNEVFLDTTTFGVVTESVDWLFWNPKDKALYVYGKDGSLSAEKKGSPEIVKSVWGD